MKRIIKGIIILVLILTNCAGIYKVCNARIMDSLALDNTEVKDRIEKIKEKGVLTIASSNDPPFAFIDTKTNELTGIDADIMKEIAKELGADKVEMKVVPFADLFEKLNTDDSIDVAADGIYITEERKKLVAFTDPLYKESEAIFVPKVSRINFKEDLKDAVIGVQRGAVYVELVKKWQNEGKVKEIVYFESVPELLSATSEGKVDASITDSIIGEYLLSKGNLYLKTLEPYTPEASGIIGAAVRKSDVTLLNAMNRKIDDMKKDKTIEKIFEKYGLSDKHLIDNIKKFS